MTVEIKTCVAIRKFMELKWNLLNIYCKLFWMFIFKILRLLKSK